MLTCDRNDPTSSSDPGALPLAGAGVDRGSETLEDHVWIVTPEDQAELESRRLRLRKRHRSMLLIAAGTVLLAFLLEVRPDQRIQLRIGPSLPLPGICGSRELFGVECPGCGLTRAFIRMTRGDWDGAFHLNRVSFLLALSVLGQFPYRLAVLAELRHGLIIERRWPRWYAWGLIAALIGNWLLVRCGI